MAAPRKLTADDLWLFKEMGNIALSPDGRRVAYVMYSLDKLENERHGVIYLLQLDGKGQAVGEPRQLTSGVKNDTNPVWAPDSRRLLFLSDREEDKNQLWLINTDGGEARKLTNMLNGVSEAAWSPDGQWIAFTAMVSLADEEEILTGRKTLEESEKKKREEEERIRLRSTTKIWYRVDGRGFFEKFNQLFVMPAPASDGSIIDASTIRRLTVDDVDRNQPSWTPDSAEISVLCNLADDRDRSEIADLWVINHETGEARHITNGTLVVVSYTWSPDGSKVLLVASQDMRIEGSCDERLYLVSRDGGEIQNLTAGLDNPAFPEASG
ncbi:MAG: TolB family protein, partial [Ktedonobacteraceae bacterium]